MSPQQLDAYLHRHIPLSRHMELRVLDTDGLSLRVQLPLAPNVNPHGTVFGGALAALGLVSAWMLLFVAFERVGLPVKLVGKQGRCDFLEPAGGDCIAHARVDQIGLDALFAQFRERGRARHTVSTVIRAGEREVARHRGVYTALTPADNRTPVT